MKRTNRGNFRDSNIGNTSNRSNPNRTSSSSYNRNYDRSDFHVSNADRHYTADSIVDHISKLPPNEKKARQEANLNRLENLRAIKYLKSQGYPITPHNIRITRARSRHVPNPRTLTDTDSALYIQRAANVNEEESIVSGKLKALGTIIFLFLMLTVLIGNFLHDNNPLVPLFKSMKENFLISILDNRGAKILEVEKTHDTMLNEADINNNIRYSFTALHTILELISKEKATKQLADEDITPALIKTLITNYQQDLIKEKLQQQNQLQQGIVSNTFDTIIKNPLKTIEHPFANTTTCQIFVGPNTMSNKGCEYSYVSFTLNKLYTPKTNTFFDVLSEPFKNYLLDNWLRSSVSLDRFLYVFLNITYYGNYQLGFKNSYLEYFGKKNMTNPSLPESIFLIEKLYTNNKRYYPNYPISVDDLTSLLYTMRYIPNGSNVAKKKTYLQDVKDQIVAINKTPAVTLGQNNPFRLYLDNIFLKGFEVFPKELLIKITTTFSMQLQNTLIKKLRSLLTTEGKKPEAAAMYVLQNGKILAAAVLTLQDNKNIYLSTIPTVHTYNSLKPFLYLTLVQNKKDIPAILLKYQYQNLIFSNRRVEFAQSQQNLLTQKNTAKGNNQQTTAPIKPVEVQSLAVLENTDIAKIPMGLKKNIAEQLDFYEYNLLSVLPITDYTNILNKITLKPKDFNRYKDLYNANTSVNLLNLVTAYSVFSNSGELRDLNYIGNINKEILLAQPKQLAIRNNYLTLLKDVYLNPIYNNEGKRFFVVFDFEVAIIFNESYTVAIWLGDIKQPYKKHDYSELLAAIVPDVINELP